MIKKIFLIVIPLVLFSSHLAQRLKTWHRVKTEVNQTQSNVERLQIERQELENKYKYYQTDEFIQREAREKLGLTQKNELILVLPEIPEIMGNKTGRKISPESPIWKQWLDMFFAEN